MLYQLCQIAKELVETLLNNPSKLTSKSAAEESNTVLTTLIEINHMRDQSRYIQNLSNWADELKVELKVLHLLFRRRNNHWIVVIGDEGKVKTFKKYLRTQCVDIDSKGRPCKERLAKDIFSQNVTKNMPIFAQDLIEEDLNSLKELKSWFAKLDLSLDHLFLEHEES